MLDRLLHRPARRRPRAARGRARPRQDARRPHARRAAIDAHVLAHPVHARHAARRRRRHARSTTRARQSSRSEAGPMFANFVLADEINRAPAKVQSALLEAMQERQVTIGDQTLRAARAVPRPGDAEPDRAGGHLPACPRRSSIASCSRSRSATRPRTTSARSSIAWPARPAPRATQGDRLRRDRARARHASADLRRRQGQGLLRRHRVRDARAAALRPRRARAV